MNESNKPVAWRIRVALDGEPCRSTLQEDEPVAADMDRLRAEGYQVEVTPLCTPTVPAIPRTSTKPSTLGQQVARAQAEMATWSPELRDSVRLEGSSDRARAAATYAVCSHVEQLQICGKRVWPWHIDGFKRTTYRRDLVKAGALLLAEIERLDRDRAAILAKRAGSAPAQEFVGKGDLD